MGIASLIRHWPLILVGSLTWAAVVFMVAAAIEVGGGDNDE